MVAGGKRKGAGRKPKDKASNLPLERVSYRVPPDVAAAIRERAKAQDVAQGDVVADAVREYLARH